MSETIITKGWAGPKGKCDICHTKKAAYWFGDTSVALCGDERCSAANRANWDRMVEEMERDRQYNEENGNGRW